MTWFLVFPYSLHNPFCLFLSAKKAKKFYDLVPRIFLIPFTTLCLFLSAKKAKNFYDLVFRILLFSSFPFAISPPPKRQKNFMIWLPALPYSFTSLRRFPLPKKARKLHIFISGFSFPHHFRPSPLSSFSFPVFMEKMCYTMF